MTTSDPVLYPLPQTEAESIRQDAARARLDLADTVEALAARLNARRQFVRKIRSATRRAGPAWAAGAGAASVAILAWLAPRGSRSPRWRHWAAGGAATGGCVATAVSVLAYVTIGRRQGPSRQAQRDRHSSDQHSSDRHSSDRDSNSQQAQRDPHSSDRDSNSRHSNDQHSSDQHSSDRHSVAIEPASSAAVSAPLVRPGQLPPNPAGRDVVDVLRDQHRQIDGTFAWVRSTEGADRREAFATIVESLHRHERAEQEIVHSVLAELGGSAALVAADRCDEEAMVDRSIASLIRRGVGNSRFAADFDELRDQVRMHAAHEELIEFPLLRERVPGDRLLTMANELQAAQAEQW